MRGIYFALLDYLGLYLPNIKAGESKLLLLEIFWLGSIEELALLKTFFQGKKHLAILVWGGGGKIWYIEAS